MVIGRRRSGAAFAKYGEFGCYGKMDRYGVKIYKYVCLSPLNVASFRYSSMPILIYESLDTSNVLITIYSNHEDFVLRAYNGKRLESAKRFVKA